MTRKIGFIDLFIDEWHSNHYPAWFKAAPRSGEFELGYAWEEKPFPGRRGLKQWCAENQMIPATTIEEVVEKSDAVCVLAPANPEAHERLAEIALQSGKPLYIDKPFADGLSTAERIFATAEKCGTPLMSSSALRFGNELLSDKLQEMKPVIFNTTGGGRSYAEYAIHQLEMIVSVMGTEVEEMRLNGDEKKVSVVLSYSGDRVATLAYAPSFPFTLSAANATESQVCPALNNTFQNLTAAILDFFATGKSPIRKEETLCIVSLLERSVALLNKK